MSESEVAQEGREEELEEREEEGESESESEDDSEFDDPEGYIDDIADEGKKKMEDLWDTGNGWISLKV